MNFTLKSYKFLTSFLIIFYVYLMLVGSIIPYTTSLGIIFYSIIFLSLFSIYIYVRQDNKFLIIEIFLIYILLLVFLQSSNLVVSIKSFMKIAMSMICFPLGFWLLGNEKGIEKLMRLIIILAILYIINIILANIFHFGVSYGGEDSVFEAGFVFSDGLYLNCYFVALFPLLYLFFRNKRKNIIFLTAIIFILFFVNMKRMTIATAVVGILISLSLFVILKNNRSTKIISNKIIKYYCYFLIIIALLLPLFIPLIKSQALIREEQLDPDILKDEVRYKELLAIYDEIILEGDISKFFFGKETFNTVGTYANGEYGKRVIHTDIALLLHSTGVVGLLSYLTIQFYIFFKIIAAYKVIRRRQTPIFFLLISITSAFFAIQILRMLSGSLYLTMSQSYYYLFMGAVYSYITKNKCIYLNKK